MDNNELLLNEDHATRVYQIKDQEEARKYRGNIDKQKEHLRNYLEYDNTAAALAGIARMKNGNDVLKAKGLSLVSMKNATERIYHKDKNDYVTMRDQKMQRFKSLYRNETQSELRDKKAEVAFEYNELIANCRVFDNDVREAVDDVLERFPTLLADLGSLEQRTEALARLVTAFLPEREFHFNPPSGDQKSLVNTYLKDFKKNPVNAILKMQESLKGERLHKDFMDAGKGMSNLRMLYADMRKRETLAVVFPHISSNAARCHEVAKMGESVEARKIMIKDLLWMNGMFFDWGRDLEFNADWVNTKTATNLNKAQKKALFERQKQSGYRLETDELKTDFDEKSRGKVLEEYIENYNAVRKNEKEINKYYKDQISSGIAAEGTLYDPKVLHKNYRSVDRFVFERSESRLFTTSKESCSVKLTEQMAGGEQEKVNVYKREYFEYRYMVESLKLAIQDANYTRYRRDCLKKMKAGATLPPSVLEKNRNKEEVRLRLLENRIEDLQKLIRLRMETGFDPERIENDRLKYLYRNEIIPEAEAGQQDEAMKEYEKIAKDEITDAQAKFRRLRDSLMDTDLSQQEGPVLSLPKAVMDEFNKMLERTRRYRLFIARKEKFTNGLLSKKQEWKEEDKRNLAKKLGKSLLNLEDLEIRDTDRRHELQMEILSPTNEQKAKMLRNNESTPEMLVHRDEDVLKDELFSTRLNVWRGLSDQEKEEYYYKKLLGRKKKPAPVEGMEFNYTDEDVVELEKADQDTLLQYFYSDEYWEYHQNFDDQGNLIEAQNIKKISERDKNKPEERNVFRIIMKIQKELSFLDGRSYPSEIREYFMEMHRRREGGWDDRGLLHGRVKFNVDRLIKPIRHKLNIEKQTIEENNRIYEETRKRADRYAKELGENSEEIENFINPLQQTVDKKGKTEKEKKEEEKQQKKEEQKKGKKKILILEEDEQKEKQPEDKLITVDDLLTAEKLKNKQQTYLSENVKYMLDSAKLKSKENLLKMGAFEDKLWKAFNNQYTEVIRQTQDDIKALEALMKKSSPAEAYNLVKKLEERLTAVSFGEARITQKTDVKKEKKIQELKVTLAKHRVEISQEILNQRNEKLKEIRSLSQMLKSVPPKALEEEEEQMGITKEVRTLRRVSLLAIKCAQYLEWDTDKTERDKTYDHKFFSRKEDLLEVKTLLRDLKERYLAPLRDKCLGDGYRALSSKSAKLGDEFAKMKFEGKEIVPALIDPEFRYYVKFCRAYTVLSKVDISKKSQKEQLPIEQEEMRKHENSLRVRILNYGFPSYTGLESEEEEESLLVYQRAKYRRFKEEEEKKKRALRVKENDKLAKELTDSGAFREAMKKYYVLKEKREKTWNGIQQNDLEKDLLGISKEILRQEAEEKAVAEKLLSAHKAYQLIKNNPSDPRTRQLLQAIVTLRDRIVKSRNRREELKKEAAGLMGDTTGEKEDVLLIEEQMQKQLGDISDMKPEWFDAETENPFETEDEDILEMRREMLLMKEGGRTAEVKERSVKDETAYVIFLVESRKNDLMRIADSVSTEVTNGNYAAPDKFVKAYLAFMTEVDKYPGYQKSPVAENRVEELRTELIKKETEIRARALNRMKEESDRAVAEYTDRMLNSGTKGVEMLTQIYSIVKERQKNVEMMKKMLRAGLEPDAEELGALQIFINRNNDSEAMKKLEETCMPFLLTYASDESLKVKEAVDGYNNASKKEKANEKEKLVKLARDLKYSVDCLKVIGNSMTVAEPLDLFRETLDSVYRITEPKKAVLDKSVTFELMQKVFGKIEAACDKLDEKTTYSELDQIMIAAIRREYDTLLGNKTKEPEDEREKWIFSLDEEEVESFRRKFKDAEEKEVKEYYQNFKERLEKLSEKVENEPLSRKMQKDYADLSADIMEAVNTKTTLTGEEIKAIGDLKNDLNTFRKEKNYLKLLNAEYPAALEIQNALEEDEKRLEQRLALHELDVEQSKKIGEMETERGKALSTLSMEEKDLKVLEKEMSRYLKLQDSKEYVDLKAHAVGNVPIIVDAAVLDLKAKIWRIKMQVLDTKFARVFKDAVTVDADLAEVLQEGYTPGSKSLGNERKLNAAAHKKLMEIRDQVDAIREEKYYHDLHDDMEAMDLLLNLEGYMRVLENGIEVRLGQDRQIGESLMMAFDMVTTNYDMLNGMSDYDDDALAKLDMLKSTYQMLMGSPHIEEAMKLAAPEIVETAKAMDEKIRSLDFKVKNRQTWKTVEKAYNDLGNEIHAILEKDGLLTAAELKRLDQLVSREIKTFEARQDYKSIADKIPQAANMTQVLRIMATALKDRKSLNDKEAKTDKELNTLIKNVDKVLNKKINADEETEKTVRAYEEQIKKNQLQKLMDFIGRSDMQSYVREGHSFLVRKVQDEIKKCEGSILTRKIYVLNNRIKPVKESMDAVLKKTGELSREEIETLVSALGTVNGLKMHEFMTELQTADPEEAQQMLVVLDAYAERANARIARK